MRRRKRFLHNLLNAMEKKLTLAQGKLRSPFFFVEVSMIFLWLWPSLLFWFFLYLHQCVSLIFNSVIAIDPQKLSCFKLCNDFEIEFSRLAAHQTLTYVAATENY